MTNSSKRNRARGKNSLFFLCLWSNRSGYATLGDLNWLSLLRSIRMKGYKVVCWPESQLLMKKDWFAECILINSKYGLKKYGAAAYYVPLSRYTTRAGDAGKMAVRY